MFLHFFINANQAIKEKGIISIKTEFQDNTIRIVFEDTGIGIMPDVINNIFEPGFTAWKFHIGVGLGLSICYKVVKEHRGEIKVTSKPGKGTAFTILLPVN